MRFRTLVILVIALALLLGLLLATRVSENGPHHGSLLGVAANAVSRLEIRSPDGAAVALERDGEKWRVADPGPYPADLARVTYVVTTLTALTSKGVISSNPAKADRFGVDDGHGIVVSLFTTGAQPAARLYVGKATPTSLDTYVRVDGSVDVHEVEGGLRASLNTDPDNWRDRVIWSFAPGAIGRIELSGAVHRVLERDEGGPWQWVGEGPDTPPDADKANRALESLTALRATGFVDELPEGEAEPLLVVSLSPFGEAPPLTLTVESRNEGGMRVVSSARAQRFRVRPGILGQLLDDPEGSFAPSPPVESGEPAMVVPPSPPPSGN